MKNVVLDSKFKKTYLVSCSVNTNYQAVPLDEMIGEDVDLEVLTSASGKPYRFAASYGEIGMHGVCIWNSTDTHSEEKPVTFTSGLKSAIAIPLPEDRMLEDEEIEGEGCLRREIYIEVVIVSSKELYNPAESMMAHSQLFDVISAAIGYDFSNEEEKYPEFTLESGAETKITGFGVIGSRYGFVPGDDFENIGEI